MKKFLNFLIFGLLVLFMQAAVGPEAATIAAAGGIAQAVGLIRIPVGSLALVSFATTDAQSYQAPNPGGLRKVLLMLSRDITDIWPRPALITNEEVTALPTVVTGKKWAEYLFPDGTAEVTADSSGDPGFMSWKHSVEFMMAGFTASVRKEIQKHLNAGCVCIVEMKDGQYAVAGSSDDPIFLKTSFKGGKKGNDKRGFTLKGEVDGMMWEIVTLDPDLVATLETYTLT